jgi:hypothetical protein
VSKVLRYVVLRHEGVPEPHFDLMLERGDGEPLATWRSSAWPIVDGTRVTPLPDHRRDYLAYQGPISDDRGYVARVADGTFRWESPAPPGATSICLLTPSEQKWVIEAAANDGTSAVRSNRGA